MPSQDLWCTSTQRRTYPHVSAPSLVLMTLSFALTRRHAYYAYFEDNSCKRAGHAHDSAVIHKRQQEVRLEHSKFRGYREGLQRHHCLPVCMVCEVSICSADTCYLLKYCTIMRRPTECSPAHTALCMPPKALCELPFSVILL